ncbi:hypothetical protein NIES2100_39280 [Calothrix sp. NIES-2100]|uniref:hypothetical protein n=1 Tax=Calothrix sp. NIES-2100 TaxID=1954172 RepID=UPI000B61EF42|nr:hypothetical protein NIES2100_39280 [Calothrix sp. NIES-2100]
MAKKQNKPKQYDVVLGTQNSAPIGSVILGGLEGVKSRLKSVDFYAAYQIHLALTPLSSALMRKQLLVVAMTKLSKYGI